MIAKLSDIGQEMNEIFKSSNLKGLSTGFKSLDKLFTVKSGFFTIIQGAPGHGKSELCFEIAMNLATKEGKRIAIFSPETGSAGDIFYELLHKYLMKPVREAMSDKEALGKAKVFVDNHFVVIRDEDRSYSIEQICSTVSEYEAESGNRVDVIIAEPWNELDHSDAMNKNNGRQDLAIEHELTLLRKYCKNTGKHFFLTMHPAKQELLRDNTDGKPYYGMPLAREAQGGQATLRKAFTWINIWRPKVGLINGENDTPYQPNELVVQVEKTKPKGVGEKGTISLFFDWRKNRYYEMNNNAASYAFEYIQMPVYRNASVFEPNKDFDNKSPF